MNPLTLDQFRRRLVANPQAAIRLDVLPLLVGYLERCWRAEMVVAVDWEDGK